MLPPPMTHSWSGGVPAVASRMAARLETVSAPSREKSGQWVMTMFRRLGRGRPPGKESSVRAAQDDRAPQGEGAKALHVRRQGEEQIIVPADGPVLIDDDDGIHSAGLLK